MIRASPIDRRLRNVALLVAGCFFMEIFDGTIVDDRRARDRRRRCTSARRPVGLVITSYLRDARDADPAQRMARRRAGARGPCSCSAIAIFTLASIGCALSVSLGVLVAMRVLQGVGGAMMVPVGRLTVLSSIAKSQLLRPPGCGRDHHPPEAEAVEAASPRRSSPPAAHRRLTRRRRPPGHAAAATSITIAFVLLALVALIPLAGALRLHPSAGDALRHAAHHRRPAAATAGAGRGSTV